MNIQIERMEKVLQRYFVNAQHLTYSPIEGINDAHYLKWEYFNGDKGKVLISIGSNGQDVKVKVCNTAIDLEATIKTLLY